MSSSSVLLTPSLWLVNTILPHLLFMDSSKGALSGGMAYPGVMTMTVIELINKNRWVVMAMSHSKDKPVEHGKLHSALIGLVQRLQQERCPNLDVHV